MVRHKENRKSVDVSYLIWPLSGLIWVDLFYWVVDATFLAPGKFGRHPTLCWPYFLLGWGMREELND